MRRADRLFRIIQLLRGRGRARTARWLAEQLEVSERTVYRDVRDLIVSGTPIEGAAGVGYTLRHYDLPPLMFEAEELEALALGARAVQSFGDESLARSAASALSKIEAVLPQRLRGQMSGAALFAPRHDAARIGAPQLVVGARRARRRARSSRSATSAPTAARARAWCARSAPSSGAVPGRSPPGASCAPTSATSASTGCSTSRRPPEHFDDEPGQSLRDYLRTIGPSAEGLLGE